MINTGNEMTPGTTVRVRSGYQHPALGAIGGWEGAVLRPFTVEGILYVDIEVTAKTIAGLSGSERGRYYNNKIVFTRVRLAQKDAEVIPTPAIQRTPSEAFAAAQHEWYDEVGEHEPDPTKFVADRTAGAGVDQGRRQAIRSLVGIGAFMVILIAFMRDNCNRGNSGGGSWGRSGGFSS